MPRGSAGADSTGGDPNPYNILPSRDFPMLPSEPADPSVLWYDADEGRYVYEEPCKSLGFELREDLGPIPVQGPSLAHPPALEQHQVNQSDIPTPGISAEPRACHHPILLDVDDRGTSDKNVSDYTGDLQPEQYHPPLAIPPSFSHSRRSANSPQPRIGREHDGNDEEQVRLEGERVRKVEVGEICKDIRHTESSDHPHNASNEDVEDPRPVKRRKLPPIPIERLAPPGEDSTTPQVSQPDSTEAT